MEILMLILLYYLSQNPDFPESVKPLMSQLKNSEQMLGFLNDLSNFTKTFSTFQKSNEAPKQPQQKQEERETKKEKSSASPTSGIANDFIERILQNYLS